MLTDFFSRMTLRRGVPLTLALGLLTVMPMPRLAAQTVVAINNPGFESPTPTVFPDYTVGATAWTRTRNDIDSGTFAPGSAVPPVTPAPIDGSQVGYANGSGGLQQVLSTGFTTGYTYSFSVYIGYRSDEINAPNGNGAMQLGYLDGSAVFNVLTTQASAPVRGQFNFVSGTYQAAPADQGRAVVVRLVSTGSVQVLFDHVELSVTAIPEPAAVAGMFGATVLALAVWRVGRRRSGLAA